MFQPHNLHGLLLLNQVVHRQESPVISRAPHLVHSHLESRLASLRVYLPDSLVGNHLVSLAVFLLGSQRDILLVNLAGYPAPCHLLNRVLSLLVFLQDSRLKFLHAYRLGNLQ